MFRNPLLQKIKTGKVALGLYLNSTDMVELCGHLGFDWFMIDQMFTAHDWRGTEELIRAGEAVGITPVVRVQSNPWLGYDHRIAVDVTRALGVGAQFVLVSNSCKKEIEECLEVAKDWHRKPLIIHPYASFEEWERTQKEKELETYIIPQVESRGALEELEDTIKLPGIKAVFIATTDTARILAGEHRPNWYHPLLWELIDRTVALCSNRGIVVGANTSYAYSMEEIKNRIRRLYEHGVRMIMVQGASFLFQVAMLELLRDVRSIWE